jgi:hypothetical protein
MYIFVNKVLKKLALLFPLKISAGEGGRGGPFKPDANYYNYDVAEKYTLVRISHQFPILKRFCATST